MSNHASFLRSTLLLGLLLLLSVPFALSASTGKITGRVTCEDTKEPAISASVQILELKTGTKTDMDGYYTILTVPPGTYTLRFGYVGYGSVKVENVVVTSDVTTIQNVSLKPEGLQTEEMVVTAEKPKVQLNATGSSTAIRSEEALQAPSEDLKGVVSAPQKAKASKGGVAREGGVRGDAMKYAPGPDANAPGVPPSQQYCYTPPPPPHPYDPNYIQRWNPGGEQYAHVPENRFKRVKTDPLSTFSIDVDAASYSNVRRFLTAGQLPPPDAVRVEEMINYFPYDYPNPNGNEPCSITTNLTVCPWEEAHYLLRIGLKARPINLRKSPPNNLVFLLDVSGSMRSENKLPLVKRAFHMLVEQMRPRDRIAIVTYAGHTGVALPSTSGADKERILGLIESLQAGGSTAGASGIQLAYNVAQENFIENGNNRIILATDGDFNVGVTSDAELVSMIEQKRKTGVFLTVLGFGEGNLKDAKMEQLADKGNGQYHYIDNILEARKVFVNELGSTLVTVAKDVKVQVEFNPGRVEGYRLIGYENRMLAAQDFNNDRKDAGEMGAGHTVTALYEIAPVGEAFTSTEIDPLRYQPSREPPRDPDVPEARSDEWLFVKVRYKEPAEDRSNLVTQAETGMPISLMKTCEDMRFAVAVAEFGMLLHNGNHYGSANFADVLQLARSGFGSDPEGYRHEFVRLVETAESLVGSR